MLINNKTKQIVWLDSHQTVIKKLTPRLNFYSEFFDRPSFISVTVPYLSLKITNIPTSS